MRFLVIGIGLAVLFFILSLLGNITNGCSVGTSLYGLGVLLTLIDNLPLNLEGRFDHKSSLAYWFFR